MKGRQNGMVSLQQHQYIAAILQVLKQVAFHELYMERLRTELAHESHFDPLTAFKSVDAFKHNKVVPYEVYSFLELKGYEVVGKECEAVVQSLNKSLSSLSFEDFLEIALPSDLNLRNASLARYEELKVEVGVLGKVNSIKQTSASKAALLLYKEVEFGRHLHHSQQEFCQRHGADLYSLNQLLFNKKDSINFGEFYEFARQYKYLFNQDEFTALYLRTKSHSLSPTERLTLDPSLNPQSFATLLLTNDLDTKQMIGLRACGKANGFERTIPSYKRSIKQREQNLKLEKKEVLPSYVRTKDFNYSYYYPEQQLFPSREHFELREKERSWEQAVGKMSDKEIMVRYHHVRKHTSLL